MYEKLDQVQGIGEERKKREKNQGGIVGYIYVPLLGAIFITFENF
jgi:hypothetical protein